MKSDDFVFGTRKYFLLEQEFLIVHKRVEDDLARFFDSSSNRANIPSV